MRCTRFISAAACATMWVAVNAYAQTCIEDGGRALCASHYPKPFSYSLCDEAAAYAYRMAAWCKVSGGTWRGVYDGCYGGTPNDEGNLVERSVRFAETIYSDACWVTSDTGWGATISSWNCWSGGPTYQEGYLTSDFRTISVGCAKGGGETIRANRGRSLECPTGYTETSTPRGWRCQRPIEPCDNCGVGNPITPSTGIKVQTEFDYTGNSPLSFSRQYHSLQFAEPFTNVMGAHSENRLGATWRTNFDKRLIPITGSLHTVAALTLPSGELQYFNAAGDPLLNHGGSSLRLVTAANGYYVNGPDSTEHYGTDGRLKSITSRAGEQVTLAYSDGTSGADGGFALDAAGNPTPLVLPANLLLRALDSYGRTLSFGYNAAGHLVVMTDPAGERYLFGYDAKSNLTSVTYPDGTKREYRYNEADNLNGWTTARHALTSIVDETGNTFASFTYGGDGRAQTTQHADGVGLTQLSYSSGTTSVTDALGTRRTLTFQTVDGLSRLKGSSLSGGSGYGAGVKDRTFDVQGNITSQTYFNGGKTCFAYDGARNLETARVDGVSSDTDCAAALASTPPGSRKFLTEWHPRWAAPTRTSGPGRVTTYVYHGDTTADGVASCAPSDALIADGTTTGRPIGVVCRMTQQATTDTASGAEGFAATPDGAPRVWTYSYNHVGQMLSMDGPRTDVADVTTLDYYGADAAPAQRGRLKRITNALGQVIEITAYTLDGSPLSVVDANGVTTTFTYDKRGRLLSRTIEGARTEYTYDSAGRLTRVTSPGGAAQDFAYDAAHRLSEVADGSGNRLVYAYDTANNLVGMTMYDAETRVLRTSRREFDAQGRLAKELDTHDQAVSYAYDSAGNLTSLTDASGRQATSTYDLLNRVKEVSLAGAVEASMSYDGQNHVTRYADARGLVTRHSYDGFGQLVATTSPDSGAMRFTHDTAGNLMAREDALGQVTRYEYDALNRLTRIVAHDSSTAELEYDQGSNGIGRLSAVRDSSGSRALRYDGRGRLVLEERGVNLGNSTVTLATEYGYDDADRLVTLKYPSGMVVTYARDAAGRVAHISTTVGGEPVSLVQNVTYALSGSVRSGVGAGGALLDWGWDTNGRLASYALGTDTRTLGYDPSGLLTSVGTAAGDLFTFGYDGRARVTSGTGPMGSFAYDFDAAGNLTRRDIAGAETRFTVASDSNRLQSASGAFEATYSYDAAGNLIGDGKRELDYDTLGRLIEVRNGSARVRYVIDVFGQRVGRLAERSAP